MLISLCVPCMDRLHDLRRTLPRMMTAAEASSPVEIAILDYNSSDGLEAYVSQFGKAITYTRYTGRNYYHIAHAWNLAVKCSGGEYIALMGADALLAEDYVSVLRLLINDGATWIRGRHYKGILCIKHSEFTAAGGYDEQFEFYGGEDKELEARLKRRNAQFGLLPDDLVFTLKTPNADKVSNYRLSLTKREMMERGTVIRQRNNAAGLLIANVGRLWGAA